MSKKNLKIVGLSGAFCRLRRKNDNKKYSENLKTPFPNVSYGVHLATPCPLL
jgi:hypothetical protein